MNQKELTTFAWAVIKRFQFGRCPACEYPIDPEEHIGDDEVEEFVKKYLQKGA